MKALLAILFILSIAVFAVAQDTTAVTQAVTATTGQELTDFPSYHPLIVHFPIVLLILGAFLAVINLYFKKPDFDTLVVGLAVAGALGAILADQIHPHMAKEVSPIIKATFKEHSNYADYSKIAAIVAALFLLVGNYFYRKAFVKYIGVALLVVSAVFVSLAGHEGAKLIHMYGVGAKGDMLRTEQGPPSGK